MELVPCAVKAQYQLSVLDMVTNTRGCARGCGIGHDGMLAPRFGESSAGVVVREEVMFRNIVRKRAFKRAWDAQSLAHLVATVANGGCPPPAADTFYVGGGCCRRHFSMGFLISTLL